jgi:hypothetical protein
MDLIPLLAVVSLGLVLAHTGLILMIWHRHETTRDHTNRIDRRLSVIEVQLIGIDDIRARQQQQSEQLSALIERSKSTQEAVLSIQDFLRTLP